MILNNRKHNKSETASRLLRFPMFTNLLFMNN